MIFTEIPDTFDGRSMRNQVRSHSVEHGFLFTCLIFEGDEGNTVSPANSWSRFGDCGDEETILLFWAFGRWGSNRRKRRSTGFYYILVLHRPATTVILEFFFQQCLPVQLLLCILEELQLWRWGGPYPSQTIFVRGFEEWVEPILAVTSHGSRGRGEERRGGQRCQDWTLRYEKQISQALPHSVSHVLWHQVLLCLFCDGAERPRRTCKAVKPHELCFHCVFFSKWLPAQISGRVGIELLFIRRNCSDHWHADFLGIEICRARKRRFLPTKQVSINFSLLPPEEIV